MTRSALPSRLSAWLRNKSRRLILPSGVFFALLCASVAQADGGHIALRATEGACSITLFTAPEPLVSGPVDLSLLVEDATTDEIAGDAHATVLLAGPHGSLSTLTLTHGAATNKLLLAALPTLSEPGDYAITLGVARPGQPDASFTTVLHVAANHRRRTTLLFALVLPLAAILLFLVNQQAKLRRRRSSASPLH